MPSSRAYRKASNFDNDLPTLPDAPTADDLKPWRDRIDQIDRSILHLLNEREAYADVIGHIKSQLDIRAFAPHREAEVLENVVSLNEGPFSDNAIRRIFEQIIEETRSLEQRKYEGTDR
jgi:chorismate mutase